MPSANRWSRRRRLLLTLLLCVVLTTVYYLAPVEPDAAGSRLVVRAALAVTGMGLLGFLIARLVAQLVRGEGADRAPVALTAALYGGVILFAFLDYLLAMSGPDEFSGLRTKTDALYFAVTTLATVGYGDIFAASQLARVLVTVQQLFNLAVIASGATVLLHHLSEPAGRSTGRARPDSAG